MSGWRQRIGRRGEEIARRRLEDIGYRILETNYRSREGEIDLVAERDGAIVFVEVRAKTGAAAGSPEESITPKKMSHLVAAAQQYLQANEAEEREWRIDLVAIEFGSGGKLLRLDVLKNAVQL